MKKLLLLLVPIIISGCASAVPADENPLRNEIVDQVPASPSGLDAQDLDEADEPFVATDHYPPHSVGALLDKEVPGGEFTVGNVLADNEAYTRYYITYVTDGLTISGIMNVPKATAGDPGPWPVLFLNHGYIDPAIYTNGRGLKREQDYFARNGYVVIHSDYRAHAQSDPNPVATDMVGESGYAKDIIGGVAAFKSLNPDYAHVNQIGMLGHSMGGGVTMRTIVARPEIVQAAVLYAPVSSDYLDNLIRWGLDRVADSEVAKVKDSNGDWDQDLIAPYSPKTYFDRVQTPVMIHHGDLDKDVPLQWSKDTLNRLKDLGRDVIYHEYSGEGHEFGIQWEKFMQRNVEFFDQHLK